MSETVSPNVSPIAIEKEMRSSFMDYAMSVIVARALPDARDGLKPVHRRILYAQKGLSNHWNRPYLKCARIVGDVIGKYHPHGDSAVYDALVRMAQDFSLRYLLIDGQGNFGSVDGDPPAAMRYTECRMARISSELLADLDKETVDWQPNYDEKELEPTVLPTKVPNLLINGSAGIAVGMATNIPPHNLREVIAACLALIASPKLSDDELFALVPGPDFPTGGIVQGRNGILMAYKTGRGTVSIRGRCHFEELRKDRSGIVVTEIPYLVNKARWIEATAGLVREKKLDGIADIRDESDRSGMRVVFELKRDAPEQVVLNNLYKMTALQSSFGINMLAIVAGQPRRLGLRDALTIFLQHRREVVTRRSLYDLREARLRREIVEGLGLAVISIDRVIAIIRSSNDTDEARGRLMAEKMSGLDGFLERAGRPAVEVEAARQAGFVYLTQRQAQAILDMRLARLTGLEREKLEAEYKELWALTDFLEGLLADDAKLMAVIVEELEHIRDQYGDDRRTEIVGEVTEILNEELIPEEEMVVTRTHKGYVKRTPVSEYTAQNRGGRGIRGAQSGGEDDFVADMFAASSHDTVLLLTSTGRMYQRRVFELPAGARTARGKPIVNVVEMQEGEEVVSLLAVKALHPDQFLFMATRQGTVKKTVLSQFANIRITGIRAMDIPEGDRMVDVRLTDGNMDVLLCTKNGYAVRFQEDQVRPMGRDARGVRGINLRKDDMLVGMGVFARDTTDSVLIVCERGYGKRTALSEYPTKNRGGMGVIAIKTSERNGPVAGLRVTSEEDHIILISTTGRLIRIPVNTISLVGRATQGVRIMRVDQDERVASIERLADMEDSESIEQAAAPEGASDDGDTVPVDVDDVVSEEPDDGEGEGEVGGGAGEAGGGDADTDTDDGDDDGDGQGGDGKDEEDKE
ncbi:MAG TPA: DNA gyrase subunit A [Kofleriaceae bacterium]|nr:DNA gyrase subunit A [Kofleriaceae bacterium]